MWLLHKKLLTWSNCVIAGIIVTIYTCVTFGTEPPLYTTNWNKCFVTEPYFKTRFDTVHSCILACQLRPKCMGVNFYRETNVCELLDNVDLSSLTLNKPMLPCVSMLKSEMFEISSCPACSGNLVCDLTTNSCIGKECPRLGPVENGQIFGNIQVDKAKAKLKCDSDFRREPAGGKLVCQAGNWRPSNPRCIPTKCPTPTDIEYTTLDVVGDASIGTNGTYTCHNHYITMTGLTTFEITCLPTGEWTSPNDTCLRDCSSPIEVVGGSYEDGTTHEGSVRQFTCDAGYWLVINDEVQQETSASVVCQTDGDWSPTVECYKVCTDTKDLVMELNDEKITASSHSLSYYPHECRFNSAKSWVPRLDDHSRYIQFNLGSQKVVKGLMTKGGRFVFVKKYKVKYNKDCSTSWNNAADNDGNEVFEGNTDLVNPKTNMFSTPIIAQCILVNPTDRSLVAMRIAILGCDV